MKAGICYLAMNDQVATQRALEQYRAIDTSFSQQREHQLLTDLEEAIEQNDGEAFSDKLFQYDSMSKLDNWKTTMLLRYDVFTYSPSLFYKQLCSLPILVCFWLLDLLTYI